MRLRIVWATICAMVVMIILAGFIPRRAIIPLGAGATARVKSVAFWTALSPEKSAEIVVQPKDGPAGTVRLWQDIFDGPAAVFPGRQANVFYCLYDFDVEYVLLKVDTSQPFGGVDTKSSLGHILFTSTWQIQEAEESDWQEATAYLRTVPASQFRRQAVPVGLRGASTAETLLKCLEYQHRK